MSVDEALARALSPGARRAIVALALRRLRYRELARRSGLSTASLWKYVKGLAPANPRAVKAALEALREDPALWREALEIARRDLGDLCSLLSDSNN